MTIASVLADSMRRKPSAHISRFLASIPGRRGRHWYDSPHRFLIKPYDPWSGVSSEATIRTSAPRWAFEPCIPAARSRRRDTRWP